MVVCRGYELVWVFWNELMYDVEVECCGDMVRE